MIRDAVEVGTESNMNQGHVRDASPGRGRHAFILAVGLGAVGMIMMHYPMIASGLARVQTDVGDTRLIQYFLEHNYRWFRGDPNHARIWDPPFFYPARNVAAHSDTMMAAAPLYGAFRVAGLAPDTSFQLWMMAISALNYAAAFHLLRRRIRVSVPSASAGAFLFAFGNMRAYQLGHQQLMPQFLSVIAVDALFGLFPARAIPWWRRAILWALVPAGVIAQLTSGVYLGWFLIFSLGIAAAVAVWLPSTRWPFLSVLRRDAPWITLSAVLGWLVLRIWVSHQVAASLELGTRFYQYVGHCLPHPPAWLCVSQSSWLEGWTIGLVEKLGWQVQNWQPCGIGLVTTVAGSAGLYLARSPVGPIAGDGRIRPVHERDGLAGCAVPGPGDVLDPGGGGDRLPGARGGSAGLPRIRGVGPRGPECRPHELCGVAGDGGRPLHAGDRLPGLRAMGRHPAREAPPRRLDGGNGPGPDAGLAPPGTRGRFRGASRRRGGRMRVAIATADRVGDPRRALVLLRPGELLGPAVDARCCGVGLPRRRRGEAALRVVPPNGLAAPEHRGFRTHGAGRFQRIRNGLAAHLQSESQGRVPCCSSRGSA